MYLDIFILNFTHAHKTFKLTIFTKKSFFKLNHLLKLLIKKQKCFVEYSLHRKDTCFDRAFMSYAIMERFFVY